MITQPQPLGVFPFPAGLLLLPPGDDTLREMLLQGRLPESWPEPYVGHGHAYAGEFDSAAMQFAGSDAVSRWNRWIVDPESVDAEALRAELGPWTALLDIVQFMTGECDDLPDAPPDARPEICALAETARASHALAQHDPSSAIAHLHTAADLVAPLSPVLEAQYRANAGTLQWEHGHDVAGAKADLQAAAAALADTDLDSLRAEVHHQLGALAHEAAAATGEPLHEAMHHYHTVLQIITRDSDPLLWARTQLNLATAYLSSPMTEATDQLRHGIATQSLRAALTVLTPDEHPDLWGTATLNLANALVYTPSTHQGDNLVESVELYEEVLLARPRDVDPLGRARVLANQGNVLAHLGIFEQAKAKLVEARFLFEEQLDHASAMSVRSVLDEIAKAATSAPDPDEEARQVAQMARMQVQPAAPPQVTIAPKPKVTVISSDQP